jgi:hypothetical protein
MNEWFLFYHTGIFPDDRLCGQGLIFEDSFRSKMPAGGGGRVSQWQSRWMGERHDAAVGVLLCRRSMD